MEAEAVPIYRFQLPLPLPQKFTASTASASASTSLIPKDRYAHAATIFKGNILVFGGANLLESSSTVILYDIAADV